MFPFLFFVFSHPFFYLKVYYNACREKSCKASSSFSSRCPIHFDSESEANSVSVYLASTTDFSASTALTTCRRVGHSFQNCGHALRCLKCVANHSAVKFTKTCNTSLTFCNCWGAHTVNYRGWTYLANSTLTIPNHSSATIITRLTNPHLTSPPITTTCSKPTTLN